MKKIPMFVSLFAALMLAACAGDKQESAVYDSTASSVADYAPRSEAEGFADDEKAKYEESPADGQSPVQGEGAPLPPPKTEGETAATAKLKIIKTGNLSLKTEDYATAKAKLYAMVKNNGAYISQESESKSPYRIENNFSVRVPSAKFDSLTNLLCGLADLVESKQISSEDVTQEYVDIETRLITKRTVLDRYRSILQEAKKIDDVMLVEDKIRVLTEEIEAREGRLRYLKDMVSLSTINVMLYQNNDYAPAENGFFKQVWRGLKNGWEGLTMFLLGLVNVWPLLIVVALSVWIFRKKWSSRNKQQQ